MKTHQLATILFVRPKRRFVVFAMVLSLFPAQEIRLGALLTDASEAPSGIQTNQQALADAEEKSCIGNLRTLSFRRFAFIVRGLLGPRLRHYLNGPKRSVQVHSPCYLVWKAGAHVLPTCPRAVPVPVVFVPVMQVVKLLA